MNPKLKGVTVKDRYIYQMVAETKTGKFIRPIPEPLNGMFKSGRIKSIRREAKERFTTPTGRLNDLAKRKDTVQLILVYPEQVVRWPSLRVELEEVVRKFVMRNHVVTLIGNTRHDLYQPIKRSFSEDEITEVKAILDKLGSTTPVISMGYKLDSPVAVKDLFDRLTFWPSVNNEMDLIEKLRKATTGAWVIEQQVNAEATEMGHYKVGNTYYHMAPVSLDYPAAYDLSGEMEDVQVMMQHFHEIQEGYVKCPKCGKVQPLLGLDTLWRLYRFTTNLCEKCNYDLGVSDVDVESFGDNIEATTTEAINRGGKKNIQIDY